MSREPVEREIELAAAPDEVWEVLADPGRLGGWLGAEVELDLRPGGSGTFRLEDGETRRARVVDVEPGRRISFAWWPVAPVVGRPTLVTITVEPDDAGSRLRVREAPSARASAAA
ncbi:MAG TPA: SRPBCC domain-containing protein [Acidimicrobiia bacterium]|nr:SRPBCC domain-containing protein [Acidimicrobiia bacterium]